MVIVIVALLILGCAHETKTIKSNHVHRNEDSLLQQSIFRIKVLQSDSSIATGTAFVTRIGHETTILTNQHVINDALKIFAFFTNDNRHFAHPLDLWSFDRLVDVAVLKPDTSDKTWDHVLIPLKFGNSDELAVAEDTTPVTVKIAGYP
ncbi:trypsin-like peptidase domain-containing protein, partial [Candidatus Jorgensenbacteria bacterium]|nr:trypsin-like peptidase domain-containing protein [Candidatus Jorgensenbacteria bacterium]